ncbi:MAG TPA: DHA2 family efflux MFS transporter permease subunit [Gaiellaceae bacterium]|nr:DHA2 family efflux MFS transporter permease subunit [Gaiellaceae bacterium]
MTESADDAARDRRRWVALAVLVATQFMVVLDIAIVNVALPTIKTDLHFSQESLQWVVTAYAILFGGALLLGGRMADLLGRRLMFMTGLVLFTASSLLDGLAWSEGALIGFRALQGLGASLLAPAALSILMTIFGEGRERNLALGIWGAVSGSGAAAGVLLGGALTSALSWSWIFFINVPVGVLVLAVSPWLLGESRAQLAHRHFDTNGAASITGGLMLLVYALTHASQHGWGTTETATLLAAAAALIVAFVVIEWRSPAPVLPLRIFRLRTLSGSNLTALLTGASIFSQFFLLTLYMQQVLHYSALKTGTAYLTFTLAIIGFSTVSQAVVTRIGIRPVLPVGLTLAAAGLLIDARLPVRGNYFWDLFPAFLLGGIGMAFAFVPMSIGALSGVRQQDAGVASGLLNTSQQIGGAIGVAVATTIATTYTGHYLASHHGASALSGAALTHGFQIAFYVLAGLTALAAVLAAAVIETRIAEPAAELAEAEVGDLMPAIEEAA